MRGRKKGEKYKIEILDSQITFRLKSKIKEKIKHKYGKNLNKMFNDWAQELSDV